MKQLHLICNAHLDPVWLWEWEEGAAEALATFRVAADFCEKHDGFVFNHNEALLYQWVESYEPELFERIRRLVADGRWHIMGGWYLQPDCVLPSGESITRHILRGRQYFQEKFGKAPSTAINFDSFGHSRGLVQILKKSGFTSYVMFRPGDVKQELVGNDLIWRGFDGSEVLVHHCADSAYSTPYGQAAETLENWLAKNQDVETGLWLWGVGDHGGGPSRKDLADMEALRARHAEMQMLHSTPEAYFAKMDAQKLPVWERGLTPELYGCYINQSQVKKGHRELENRFYFTEKLLSLAALQNLLPYPAQELRKAEEALLFTQFHDILPGSDVPCAEKAALHKIGFGMDLLSQLRMRAVFALSRGIEPIRDGESTFLVYNPHPYPVNTLLECELMTPVQNTRPGFQYPTVWKDGQQVPSQPSQPETSLWIDWRKKVVFQAELEPCSVTRYDCRFEMLAKRPKARTPECDILFDNGEMQTVINHKTGLLDLYCRNGQEYLKPGSLAVNVYADGFDTWHPADPLGSRVIGRFELMTPEECAAFCAVPVPALPAVHVTEDGDVRMAVEAALKYESSKLLIRYLLPKSGGEIGVEMRLFWMEKEKLARLALSPAMESGVPCAQTMWGAETMDASGRENAIQRWCGMRDETRFLTVINDGASAASIGPSGELRIALLRSAGYGTSDSEDRLLCNRPDDCFKDRMDQGLRAFAFWLQGEAADARSGCIDREAQLHSETPYLLPMNPSGSGKPHANALLSIDESSVIAEAIKPAEDGNGFILRLRNPLAQQQPCTLRCCGHTYQTVLQPYEVRTCRFAPASGAITAEGLLS